VIMNIPRDEPNVDVMTTSRRDGDVTPTEPNATPAFAIVSLKLTSNRNRKQLAGSDKRHKSYSHHKNTKINTKSRKKHNNHSATINNEVSTEQRCTRLVSLNLNVNRPWSSSYSAAALSAAASACNSKTGWRQTVRINHLLYSVTNRLASSDCTSHCDIIPSTIWLGLCYTLQYKIGWSLWQVCSTMTGTSTKFPFLGRQYLSLLSIILPLFADDIIISIE